MGMRVILSVAVIAILAVSSEAAGEIFSDRSLGYSIEPPAGWQAGRPDAYTVRFDGPAGAYLKLQTVATATRGGAYADLGALVSALKCQLAAGADTISIYGATSFNMDDADGVHLDGWQFLTDYTYGGVAVREWYVVVARAPGDVFYVVSYTASEGAYAGSEEAVLESLRTWTIAGASGALPAAEPGAPGASSAGAGEIVAILQDRGHIGPYHYAEDTYDKRWYEFTVSTSGYVALCVVDQVGEAITGWIFAPGGAEVTRKPGNYADVYTSSYPIEAGTYTVKVGQDHMATESDFEMAVYFSLSPFTIDDLVARFGPRVRVLP